MPLSELTNYKNGFSLIKVVVISSLIIMGIITSICVYFSYTTLEKVSNTVYVLNANGEISVAEKTNINEPKARKIEYVAHVKTFYKLWYQFDESNFKDNINDALYLAGNCAKEMKLAYDQDDLNTKLQRFNMRCIVAIDSIAINTNSTPISGKIYGVQSILRPSGSIRRRMDCSFQLFDFDRSDKNPHGVKIENWKAFNVAEIKDDGQPVSETQVTSPIPSDN